MVGPLRITFLCPHVRIAGGVRAILGYADRLAARSHAVTVVVPARRPWKTVWRRFAGAGPDWMPRFRPRLAWTTRWSAADLPPGDAVVATAWQSARVVADAPAACGARFYLVQHYESLYHGAPAEVDASYRLPLAKIVISTWLRDILRDRFGERSEVIVTPVDPTLFSPAGVPDARRVLMLHHEYPWKGVADGLEALARVRARHPGLRVVGFGVKSPRGPMPYDEFHANLPQERLRHLYSGCGIYLCPSWDEGLGMPSMEAMACGAALCTYDNGGCREYARDGETALVARRRDVADLAAKLERLVEDDVLRQTLARAGQAFVRSAFDWDRAVSRLEGFLAAGAREPAC
jgi:glycosyltransferase involved in cell wall biosynthesis